MSLTGNAQAVTTAVQKYVSLLTDQSDNNVKLIVLGKLKEVRKYHGDVMQNFVMDVFRGLNSPSLDVRKKVMELSLPLVNSKNVKEVVALLKKELIKTSSPELSASDKGYKQEYRKMLITALHVCTSQSTEEAQTIMYLLIDFLTESDFAASAPDVILYIRELISNFQTLRAPILSRLAGSLGEMQHSRVLRGCLWLFGEYASPEQIPDLIETILECLRPLPIVKKDDDDKKKRSNSKDGKEDIKTVTKTVILADGTYGTEDVAV